MKKTTLSLALLFLFGSFVAFSQEETEAVEVKKEKNTDEIHTLFKDKSGGHYIGFSFNYVEIEDQHGMQFGLRGGWIAGHGLAVGLGAKVFFNESKEDEFIVPDPPMSNLIGGYGGLLIEPIVLPRFPVHLSFPVLAGVGGIAYTIDKERFTDNSIEDSDFFLVVEPGVELEFNILKHFRIAIGAYYTLTSDIKLEYQNPDVPIVGPNVIRGFNMGITLKLGRF
jgi:hypothetical protein